MTDNQIISTLLYKYMQGTLSAEESAALEEWKAERQANRDLFDELSSEDLLAKAIADYHPDNKKVLEDRILKNVLEKLPGDATVPLFRKRIFQWMAAASILVMVGLGIRVLWGWHNRPASIAKNAINDIKAPASNRATLTLANGQHIYLDSVKNGQLATQGNTTLLKMDNGQIAYRSAHGEPEKEFQYNTITNPRGSRIVDIALADGSQVWLNAGSSITYPVAFRGGERKVSITGEAYFEVAHDIRKPFKVTEGKMEVEVLGTHFNVNAFKDEDGVKVTLLEGSVKVLLHGIGGDQTKILMPGQQSQIDDSAAIKVKLDPDLEQVMAWKNGQFIFNGNDIKSVMRQLANWYDIDVEYNGTITKREFVGVISRDVNILQILKMLQKTKAVSFEIENKKVIVK